jgi:hypothetical protein
MGAAIPAIGLGLQIFGTITGANAQRQQGEAQYQANMFQADQLEQTAKSMETQSKLKIADFRNMVAGADATQKTVLAANGIDASSVTAQDIAEDTALKGKLDELAIKYNDDLQIWQTRKQAEAYRMAGSNAVTAANTAANATIIGGATGVADTWDRWSKTSMGK